jgi:hypothetical protein
MNNNSTDTTDLLNDFSHLGRLENLTYRNSAGTQHIEIKHPDNFIIEIVIPDGIFEWFMDIFDSQKNKLVSDWSDGYGEPKDVLIADRQKDVEEFVHDVLNNKMRFRVDKKFLREKLIVEIFKDNTWTELISNTKWKI